jgi:hypothetical protein
MSLILRLLNLPAGNFYSLRTCAVVVARTNQLVVKGNSRQVVLRNSN